MESSIFYVALTTVGAPLGSFLASLVTDRFERKWCLVVFGTAIAVCGLLLRADLQPRPHRRLRLPRQPDRTRLHRAGLRLLPRAVRHPRPLAGHRRLLRPRPAVQRPRPARHRRALHRDRLPQRLRLHRGHLAVRRGGAGHLRSAHASRTGHRGPPSCRRPRAERLRIEANCQRYRHAGWQQWPQESAPTPRGRGRDHSLGRGRRRPPRRHRRRRVRPQPAPGRSRPVRAVRRQPRQHPHRAPRSSAPKASWNASRTGAPGCGRSRSPRPSRSPRSGWSLEGLCAREGGHAAHRRRPRPPARHRHRDAGGRPVRATCWATPS